MNEAPGSELDDLPPPPPASDPAPAENPAPPVEPEAIEIGGKSMVPVAAVIAEREKRQAAEQKAARVDELESYVATNKTLIEFIQNNKDLLSPRKVDRAPDPVPPSEDPGLLELAQSLDFYTADGKPDLKRAEKHRELVRKEARAIADERVRPHEQQTLEDRATANYNLMLQAKLPDGTPLRKDVVDALWTATAQEPGGLRSLADRRTVSALTVTAIGAQVLAGKSPAAAVPALKPPPVSEPAGGSRLAAPKPMSDIELRVAKHRGKDPQHMAQQTQTFIKGRPNTLEDD